MKIAFITSGTIKSSISYRCLAFAKEFVNRGHNVSIFSPRFDKYSKFKDEEITEIDEVKIIRPLQMKILPFELGLIPYILSTIYLLHKMDPDIIHIYKATPITILGLFLKLTRKKIVIFDTDDLDSVVMKIEKNPPLKIKLVELSEKILVKYASAIVTGSKYLQTLYSSQDRNKIVKHIPNGAEFMINYKIVPGKISEKRIIFIGNINRINILEPLFMAVKDMKEKKIYPSVRIIGDGTYLPYFKNLAKKLNLHHIEFLGRIPQNELYKYVRVGDIGYSYMPNEETQKACSNMKVFQYMQFGAVPVVSNVGDLPLYVSYGKAGYIAEHSNIEDLTKVLSNSVMNKEDRTKKIYYSQKNSSRIYSWKALSLKLENLYIQLGGN